MSSSETVSPSEQKLLVSDDDTVLKKRGVRKHGMQITLNDRKKKLTKQINRCACYTERSFRNYSSGFMVGETTNLKVDIAGIPSRFKVPLAGNSPDVLLDSDARLSLILSLSVVDPEGPLPSMDLSSSEFFSLSFGPTSKSISHRMEEGLVRRGRSKGVELIRESLTAAESRPVASPIRLSSAEVKVEEERRSTALFVVAASGPDEDDDDEEFDSPNPKPSPRVVVAVVVICACV